MTAIATIRRFLLALVVFGLAGTGTELVLLGHYEDSWQVVPLALIATSLVAVAGHLAAGGPGTIRMLRLAMGLLIVAGAVGALLHYRGNAEFQLEMDPSQSGWEVFVNAIHATTPPALAPGVLSQLGLLGLVYTYRHPSLERRS